MRAAALAAAAAAGVTAAAFAGGPAARAARPLPAFDSCGQLLRYAKRQAARLVGPYGLGGVTRTDAPGAEAPPAAGGAPDAAAEQVAAEPTGTNVQEAGVDEPDLVKTNGSVVFAVAQGKLQAVDVGAGGPRLVGSLPLGEGFGHQLLLHENRLLVLSSGGFFGEPLPTEPGPGVAADVLPYPETPQTFLTEVDVSDPAAMTVVRTVTIEASLVAARAHGATARVIVSSEPTGLELVYPDGSGPEALAEAETANEAEIRSSTLASWVPRYRVRLQDGRESAPRRLVPCAEVRRPRAFSGLGLLTVLTLDLTRGVVPVDSDAVMAGGEIAYASPTGLYVATQRWVDPAVYQGQLDAPPPVTTAIHKFDVSSPRSTEYRSSGAVPGYLLSQWSLSELDGLLRVVSTEAPLWWGGPESEGASALTVLADREGRLVRVGRLDGLGRRERVYAVRFVAELGYVVTFRQVDPLHVIDLSDPASPRLRGELQIPGYSAYLHPIGGGLLLGVGQDADLEGRLRGAQVSVFDVSDPASPARLHVHPLGQSFSEAEYDHHAFLYDPPARIAVLPLDAHGVDVLGLDTWWSGAVVLRVGRDGIEELRAIAHEPLPAPEGAEPSLQPSPTPIRRSLVLGDSLYTVSEAGLRATGLVTLGDTAWVPFL
jgi:hypothetical protein